MMSVKLVGTTVPNFSKFVFELYSVYVLWFHDDFINSVSHRMTPKNYITCSEVFLRFKKGYYSNGCQYVEKM